MSERLRRAEAELYDLLGPELREITAIVSTEQGPQNLYLVELPDAQTVDLSMEELASLVARTANAYGRIARFSGMANAEYKLAKGRYDRKYKRSRVGRNDAERDKAAMDECEEEHLAMTVAEAIKDLADSLEHAARVASESSRKIYGQAQSMMMAQNRESHGTYKDSDFRFNEP